jgi:uncharacterized protein
LSDPRVPTPADAARAAMHPAHAAAHPEPSPIRWFLAFVGVAFVGLAGIGVVVPGMPTTVFLIAACWCFTRSCPWLERRLVRNRFFAPFLAYLEPGAVMPLRARLVTLGIMWGCVSASVALLVARGLAWWAPTLIVLAALVGSVCVWRLGRPR